MPFRRATAKNHFNSTLVRLKADYAEQLVIEGLFQFHTGSIKGPYPDKDGNAQGHFNSTLVRLKDA